MDDYLLMSAPPKVVGGCQLAAAPAGLTEAAGTGLTRGRLYNVAGQATTPTSCGEAVSPSQQFSLAGSHNRPEAAGGGGRVAGLRSIQMQLQSCQ